LRPSASISLAKIIFAAAVGAAGKVKTWRGGGGDDAENRRRWYRKKTTRLEL